MMNNNLFLMHKKSFLRDLKVTIIVSLLCTFSSNGFGQTSGLKTYEGEYELKGLFELRGIMGKAKYQYMDAPEGTPIYDGCLIGTRMYDGPFVFDGQGLHAEGYFRKNRQIGTWHWENRNRNWTAVIHFNDNGELSGDFEFYWGGFKAKGVITKGRKPWGDSYTNYISHIKTSSSNIEAEGGFNNEDKGVGTWKVREFNGSVFRKQINSNYNNEWTYAVFEEPGYLGSWYFIDSSTGDKVDMGGKVNNILSNINHEVWKILSGFTFRQTLTLHY